MVAQKDEAQSTLNPRKLCGWRAASCLPIQLDFKLGPHIHPGIEAKPEAQVAA